MKSLEGQILIRLPEDASGAVQIINQRPQGASKLLQGKTVAQALEIVPLLFNICGMAQARTACLASETALGQQAAPAVEQARELLVLMEWAREHLARILIDWPRLFDQPSMVRALPAVGTLVAQLRDRLFPHGRPFALNATAAPFSSELPEIGRLEQLLEAQVYHMPAHRWAEMDDIQALIDWSREAPGVAASSVRRICDAGWASQGHCETAPLPAVAPQDMVGRLADADAEDFTRQPTWDDRPCETSSYTRQRAHPLVAALAEEFGQGLLTRWVARLVELDGLPQRMRQLAAAADSPATPVEEPTAGAGLGQSEAARGRLYHYVETDGDRIDRYRILAPTEWNFHPDGVAARSLGRLSLPDAEERRHVAELLINAIDPCVACRVEYAHA